jgi:poly(3-hydroxybutyrate) depolymerase/prenyltransferase beta subunit
MKRILLGLAICGFALVPSTRGQSPEDLERVSAQVAALQNADGGFSTAPGGTSTLPTTSTAIRVLKNTGGSIRDVFACVRFVKSCADAESGGFAPIPGGKPDVRTTAVGLMAVAELKIPADDLAKKAIAYFSKNVREFEDIRIAVAGLEAVKKTSPDFPKWTQQVESRRGSDYVFGRGDDRARETGSAAAALLRMGVKLSQREAIVQAMKGGQRPDGGWGKGSGGSDLESTYRVMRAFYMLQEKPDLEKLKGFIARCRQSDGGYSVAPGGASELSGAYFATTVLRWVKLLQGEPALLETAGFKPLFNGKDLAGWEGDTALWSARDGMIVGRSPGLKHNDFLATEKSYGDFILKLSFRLIGPDGSNSGVQFRSVRIPGHEMSGYQADIGQNYWGCLYDESRRNKILEQAKPDALKALRKSDWNQYEVRAMGSRIVLRLNGVTSVDYKETDPTVARDGKIALQIHAGGPMEIQFKDVLIQTLPTRTAENADRPGFHVRTLETGGGEKKYTVFVPPGYDGARTFPVVLFLHGSGERGDDGVNSAQVGLGAAIAGHPEDYPVIAVCPQAKQSWRADSDDIRDALATLEDALANYRVDRSRVALTGLSKGGSGSWGLAAARPELFAAVVPICGSGRTETASSLKGLPVWTFVGDADRDRTVLGTRAMVEGVRAAGGKALETEYRGVGHNSWDRAYNDPALVAWMLAQKRP